MSKRALRQLPIWQTSNPLVILVMVMTLILTGCGATNAPAAKAVISSPQANAEFMSSSPIQIQGQADGAGIVRVDVIIDSNVLSSVAASDATSGVTSLPVSVPYTTQTIGTHFVQLKVYAAGDKLIAVSDPLIFTIRLAAVTPTQPPPPTPTQAPTVAPAVVPTAAGVTTTTSTTATVAAPASGDVAPTLTITNEFANIRSGPGINFDIVGKLNQNEKAPVRGKSPDGLWWQIAFDKGTNGVGWVRGDLVSVNAAAAAVAAVTLPPTPTSPPTQPPPPEQPTAIPPTAASTTVAVAAATATPSDSLCNASMKEWRGQNPNYPFCSSKDPGWADPNDEYLVFDNGRNIPLSLSWNIFGSNIKQMWIHFSQDNSGACGFTTLTQKTIDQQVSPAGKFDFNVQDFPYGGSMRISWSVVLADGRSVEWGFKKFCIR